MTLRRLGGTPLGLSQDKLVQARTLAFDLRSPAGYLPDPDLMAAVNAALILGQPLLLSGEPGVGKSSLAPAISFALDLPLLEVTAHSDLQRRDLFYDFDHMRRLYDVQAKLIQPDLNYMKINSLGAAMLMAVDTSQRFEFIIGTNKPQISFDDLMPDGIKVNGKDILGPTKSVVLIDEIDKAPRSLLNDILNELDSMSFEIPELNIRVQAIDQFRPIVIFTSNSERALPEPFLRRCAFHHINFPPLDHSEAQAMYPDKDPSDVPTLSDIVASRVMQVDARDRLLADAISLFKRIRSSSSAIRRLPATFELLNLMILLVEDAQMKGTDSLVENRDKIQKYFSVIFKSQEDISAGEAIVKEWGDYWDLRKSRSK